MKKYLIGFTVLMLITGCTVKNSMETTKTFTNSADEVAYELSDFSEFSIAKALFKNKFKIFNDLGVHANKTIIVTSIVDVNNIKKTSDFGRLYSDTMITELKRNNWKVIDIRGNDSIFTNENGEYYLNKDKIALYPKNSYVLVGTYGKYKDGLISNLRLLNLLDNEVMSASNIYIKDKEVVKMAGYETVKSEKRYTMEIIEDDCSSAKECKE